MLAPPARLPETILKGVRNNLSRHVRIRHAGLKRQERAFAAGLITDQIEYRWLIHFRDRDGIASLVVTRSVAEGEGHVVARRPCVWFGVQTNSLSRRVECRPLRQASRAVDQRRAGTSPSLPFIVKRNSFLLSTLLFPDWVEHWRSIDIRDGDRNGFARRYKPIRDGEGHVIDTRPPDFRLAST